jgi:hypothetical protein
MNFCLPSAPLGASIHAGISLGIIMMTNIAFIHYGDNVIRDNPPTVNDYETQQAPPVRRQESWKSLSQIVQPLFIIKNKNYNNSTFYRLQLRAVSFQVLFYILPEQYNYNNTDIIQNKLQCSHHNEISTAASQLLSGIIHKAL